MSAGNRMERNKFQMPSEIVLTETYFNMDFLRKLANQKPDSPVDEIKY